MDAQPDARPELTTLLLEVADGVATVTLNRPEVYNAFNPTMVDELAALGVTDVITVPWYFYGGDPEALDTKLRDLERFADEIITPIRART